MPIDLDHIIDHTAFDIYTLLLLTLNPLWCGVRIAPLPFPRYVVRGD